MGIRDFFNSSSRQQTSSMAIDESWLKEVCDAIMSHEEMPRVAYGENQSLQVVGESYYLDNLKKLANGRSGEEAGWLSGFLVPEPLNKFDSNAVAVYAILENKEGYEGLKVGYLPKDIAAKTNLKISRLIAQQGKLVPVLISLSGGTLQKPNYGVNASARTSAFNFY